MLLRKDEERLERLNGIVKNQGQAATVKILMDVAAELDGRADNYDGMDAAAKRKATRDMTKLIGKVEEMRSAIEHRIDDGKDEIVSHVDTVGAKVDRIKFKGTAHGNKCVRDANVCLYRHSAFKDTGKPKTSSLTGLIQYQEFYPRLSKPIIDEIDELLAKHYGFTEEELDFIINYDIKYRMGDELNAGE